MSSTIIFGVGPKADSSAAAGGGKPEVKLLGLGSEHKLMLLGVFWDPTFKYVCMLLDKKPHL